MTNPSALRGVIITGLFALLLTPFLVTGSFLFPFITGKAFFFRAIVEVIFVAWAALAIARPEYRPKKSLLMTIFSLFLAALAVSTALSPNPFKSFWSNYERMEGYVTLIHLFLLFVVMGSVMKEAKQWRQWWKGFAWSSAIMIVYAFFQLAGKITINQGGVRVDGTLGNAAYLASYLLFAFFTTLFLFAHEKKIGLRIAYGILGFCQLFVIYRTETRGAILGLLAGLGLTGLILAFKSKGKIRTAGIATLVGLVVLAGAFFAARNTDFVKHNSTLNRFASLSVAEFRTQGRYYVWPMALRGIAERPVFGWGIESFNYVFNEHYNPAMYQQEPWFDRAHDIYLDWLIAGGVIGGGLFIALCLAAFVKAIKEREDNPEFRGESAAIIAGLLFAYFFQGIFVFDNIVSYLFFVSFLAYLHSRSAKSISRFEGWRPSEGVKRTVPALLAVVVAGTLYWGIVKPMIASAHIIDALKAENQQQFDVTLSELSAATALNTLGDGEAREQMIAFAPYVAQLNNPQFAEKYIATVKAEMQAQLRVSPDDARTLLLYGAFLNQVSQPDEALLVLQKAATYSPKKQMIYFEIGKAYLAKRDTADALKALQYAYDLEPDSDEAKLSLGIGYLYASDDAKAEALFKSMTDPSVPLFDNRLIAALYTLNRFQDIVMILKGRVAAEPGSVNDYISLASAYLKVGDRADAIQALQKVGELQPGYKDAANNYIEQIKQGKTF